MTCLLLCSALIAGFLNVRAEPRYYEQNFNSLHVPELDAGFHPPYELEVSGGRDQFRAWQRSHPKDPLGSASDATSYLFEEC